MILDHPIKIGLILTGIILLVLWVKGQARPKRIIATLLLVIAGIIVWRVLSPREDKEEIHAADTVRILIGNRKALDDWYSEAGSYPPSGQQGLIDLRTYAGSSVYMKDAWGRDLRYEVKNGNARIISAGPDGAFNTQDDMAK